MLIIIYSFKKGNGMTVSTALISDFDGTITPEDFFWYVSKKFLDDKALQPWQEYLAGKLSHIDALNRIFSAIKIPSNEFDAFIKEIPFDENFIKTAELCNSKDIPLYICSAGCDYYIERILGEYIKKYKITLVTNHGTYNPKQGLKMEPLPQTSPYYDKNVGISKAGLVKKIKEEGYEVIFAGDGPPDIAPAEIADIVFARKILLQECKIKGIKYQPFDSFHDIYVYLKGR